MKRRVFLTAGAVFAVGARAGLAAPGPGIWTRLPARPDGGLPILVVPPAGAGPHPVILFSHGLGGNPEGFVRLVSPWAAAGFLVLLPEHLDSLKRGAPRRPTFPELERYAFARIDDIRAMLDALPALAAKAGTAIEPGAIGMSGHSFGSWTSAVIAGATIYRQAGRPESFPDPRPRAFLLLSGPPVPPGASPTRPFDGMAPDSFAHVTRPLMLFDGTRDNAPPGGPGSYRARLAIFNLSPPGSKYLAIEREGTHMTTAGIAPARDRAMVAIARRSIADLHALALPFWRGFVSGDTASIAWLNGSGPAAIDPANLTITRRLG